MPDHNEKNLTTPVALILFNRPDKTAQSFAEIAKAKPSQLFLIADGPRNHRPSDAENCAAARAVVEKIDWDCTVYRNYSEVNLGCKQRVSSGIDWVFTQVEEAIIIEDDIVVGPDFFDFMQQMLAFYRHDTRIMHISGCNVFKPDPTYPYSYYYSHWPLVWGWATWRRAWQSFDVKLSLWSPRVRTLLADYKLLTPHLLDQLEATHRGEVDSWAYGWLYSVMINSGLTVIPRNSLVQNIGFGSDATHTTNSVFSDTNRALVQVTAPLNHPPYMMADTDYETALAAKLRPRRLGTLRRHLKQIVKRHAKTKR